MSTTIATYIGYPTDICTQQLCIDPPVDRTTADVAANYLPYESVHLRLCPGKHHLAWADLGPDGRGADPGQQRSVIGGVLRWGFAFAND